MAPSAGDTLKQREVAVKGQENMLTDVRKQRKETDEQLQAMMNRIAFLAQEEAKLDRDIDAARRRAAEALARQGQKDQEIAATAKEVLAVLPSPSNTGGKLRPHTGRSSLLATLSDAGGSRASLGVQPSCSSSRSLDSEPAAPRGQGAAGSSAAAGPGRQGAAAARSASASRGRPPVPTPPRPGDRARKAVPTAGEGGGTTPGTASPASGPGGTGRPHTPSRRPGATTATATAATGLSPSGSLHRQGSGSARRPSSTGSAGGGSSGSRAAGAAGLEALPGERAAGRGSSAEAGLALGAGGHAAQSGMQQLGGGRAGSQSDLAHGHGHEERAAGGPNAMRVLHGSAADAGELDGEVVEELLAGSSSAAGGGGGRGAGGLQTFETESGRKVVQVKATNSRRDGSSSTVVAAGVGWGMGGRPAASIPAREAKQLKAELTKKQQIWKVRKTFGLEPTPMSDATAQVEEVGAGAWQ